MERKKSSIIWKAFTSEDCDPKFAKCLFCDKMVSRGSDIPRLQTTTNLKDHMKKKHAEDWRKLEELEATNKNGNF